MSDNMNTQTVEHLTPEVPRWKQLQEQNIASAVALIKEHGADVEFLVIKDKFFLKESIEPIINIDKSLDFLFRLEGRAIDSKEIQEFRKEYADLVVAIKSLQDRAVTMFANARYANVDHLPLRKLIREKMKSKTVKTEVTPEVETKTATKK